MDYLSRVVSVLFRGYPDIQEPMLNFLPPEQIEKHRQYTREGEAIYLNKVNGIRSEFVCGSGRRGWGQSFGQHNLLTCRRGDRVDGRGGCQQPPERADCQAGVR